MFFFFFKLIYWSIRSGVAEFESPGVLQWYCARFSGVARKIFSWVGSHEKFSFLMGQYLYEDKYKCNNAAHPQLSIFISHSLRYTLPSELHVSLSFSLSQFTGHALAEPTRFRSWLRQKAMGTSNTCLPQFLDFIRHALL